MHTHPRRLTITRARFGGRACTNPQNRANRFYCEPHAGAAHAAAPTAYLRIGEVPWPDIPALPRDCLCSEIIGSLNLAPMAASTVEAQFAVLGMAIDEDFRDYYFEGRYEFVKDDCHTNWEERRLKSIGGEALLGPSRCTAQIQPWLVEPETDGAHLALLLKGFWMPPVLHSMPPCPTSARITVYTSNHPQHGRDLCPSGHTDVVYNSDGWSGGAAGGHFVPVEPSRHVVVEFWSPWRGGVGVEPAAEQGHRFRWLEIHADAECAYRCTELQACIAAVLWCDGRAHCPNGQDEDPMVCDTPPPLSPLQVGLAVAAVTILLSLVAGLAACARRKRSEKASAYPHDRGQVLVTGGLGHLARNGNGNGGGAAAAVNGYASAASAAAHQHAQYHYHQAHQQQQQQYHGMPPLYFDAPQHQQQSKDSFC